MAFVVCAVCSAVRNLLSSPPGRRSAPAVVLQGEVRPPDVHEQCPKYSSNKYIEPKCSCVLSVRAFILYFIRAVHKFYCRLGITWTHNHDNQWECWQACYVFCAMFAHKNGTLPCLPRSELLLNVRPHLQTWRSCPFLPLIVIFTLSSFFTPSSCWTAGCMSEPRRPCDRPSRHRFCLVSLCL